MDGMGQNIKSVVLLFFPFGVYRTCIYLYILKNFHQHSYGFQNLMSSWGWGPDFSKLQQVGDVSFFQSKNSLFIFTNTWEAFFAKKYQFLIFLWLFIFIEYFIKDFTKDFNKDFIKGFTNDKVYIYLLIHVIP